MDFGEFQELRSAKGRDSGIRPAFDRIGYLFDGFHPKTRPVLWRVLVAQAHIYEALLKARGLADIDKEAIATIRHVDRAKIIWSEGESGDEAKESMQAIRVGLAYAEQRCTAGWSGGHSSR
jgi:hypothetical protein